MTVHMRIARLMTLLALCIVFAVPALARGGGGFHFRSSGFHAWRIPAPRERGFAAGFRPRTAERSPGRSAFGGFRASTTPNPSRQPRSALSSELGRSAATRRALAATQPPEPARSTQEFRGPADSADGARRFGRQGSLIGGHDWGGGFWSNFLMFEGLRSLLGWHSAPVAATRVGAALPGARPASVPAAASASAASQSSWLPSVLFVVVVAAFVAFAVRRTLAAARRRDRSNYRL